MADYARRVVHVPLKSLDHELSSPTRMRSGDAAADLPARTTTELPPGGRALVPTGFAVAIPEGWCGLILPRSGLALTHGVTVLNAPGLIDAGYRGELQVVLHNTGTETVVLDRGQRIAQLLVLPVPPLDFEAVTELPPSIDRRGAQGFGSSGQ